LNTTFHLQSALLSLLFVLLHFHGNFIFLSLIIFTLLHNTLQSLREGVTEDTSYPGRVRTGTQGNEKTHAQFYVTKSKVDVRFLQLQRW